MDENNEHTYDLILNCKTMFVDGKFLYATTEEISANDDDDCLSMLDPLGNELKMLIVTSLFSALSKLSGLLIERGNDPKHYGYDEKRSEFFDLLDENQSVYKRFDVDQIISQNSFTNAKHGVFNKKR